MTRSPLPLFLLLVFILPSTVYFGLALVYFPESANDINDSLQDNKLGESIVLVAILVGIVGGLFVGTVAFAFETLLRLLGRGIACFLFGWKPRVLADIDYLAYANIEGKESQHPYLHQLVAMGAMHTNLTFGSLFMLLGFLGLVLLGDQSHTGSAFEHERLLAGAVFFAANLIVANRLLRWAADAIKKVSGAGQEPSEATASRRRRLGCWLGSRIR